MSLVNLKKRVKVKGAWTYVAVPRKSGRFVPDRVTTPGTFYIEWRQDGKRRQEVVGTNPRSALEALRVKQGQLDDRPSAPVEDTEAGATLPGACDTFLVNVKATRSEATHRTYSVQTKWFLKHTTKTYVSEITRDDIMALFAKGREEGSDQKTVNKRVVVVLGMLRNAGHDVKLKKGDWPKLADDPEPEVYRQDELQRFFAVCNERERVLFYVFLYSGFRHMEVATLVWNGDVDWSNNTLKVRMKPELGFAPKNYEWRSVRVPMGVMVLLKSWKEKSTTSMVFPSPVHPTRPKYGGESVDYHMLETCKEIAERAGLNCGKCKTSQGRCIKGPYCERWYLHKFRHTFATNTLRDGVDLKTLQSLLGHKSLATTEKYLKSLRHHDLEQQVENSTLAKLLITSGA